MSKRGPKLGRDTQAKKHCFKENKKQKKFSQVFTIARKENKTISRQYNTQACVWNQSFICYANLHYFRSFGEPVSIQKTLTPALSS